MSKFNASGPDIFVCDLPEAERETASAASDQMRRLPFYVQRFEDAVALFEMARDIVRELNAKRSGDLSNPAYNWKHIAARDATITLYDYRSTLYSLRDSILASPTLRSFIDTRELERAVSPFQRQFPRVVEARHGSAHSADFINKNIKDHAKVDATTIPGVVVAGGVDTEKKSYFSGLVGSKAVYTYLGEIVTVDVTRDTSDRLGGICLDVFHSLRGIQTGMDKLKDEHLARLRKAEQTN